MKITYNFLNGERTEIEISEELGDVVRELERLEANSNNVQSRHCVSIEIFKFTDRLLSYDENPQIQLERREFSDSLAELASCLSRAQARRLLLYAEGYSMHKIASMENVAYNAVYKSISSAKKLFSMFFVKTGGQKPL